jgi:colanic acid biosynthesis glycosyl transferase WcaI
VSAAPKRAEHVLVLTLIFPPEAVSTSQLLGELVEDLVRQGRRVTVITTKPHFHPANAAEQRRGLVGGWLARSEFAGASVFHTAMPLKAGGLWQRAIGWIGFHVLSVIAAIVAVGRAQVVLAPSPPLTIGVAAWLIARLKGARYVYNVQELYPDTAVALGALRPGLLLNVLYAVERFIYRRAFAIAVIGSGMRDRIIAKGITAAKVRLIPNFVDTATIAERPKDNPFSRAHGLHDRFVVMYAGNIGRAQGLEVILGAAALTTDRKDIVYAIVGEGALRAELMDAARARSLGNVTFVEQQPYERVPDIYGASDVNVVPLAGSLVDDAVPSKVYRIMAARRPVLAIVDSRSDVARIVEDARAGWVVPPGDAQALAALIRRVADEGVGDRGESGRRYAKANVERATVTAAYGALLDEAARG